MTPTSRRGLGLFGAICWLGIGCFQTPADKTDPDTVIRVIEQFGPVGYRDPLAAVSPDGKWIAAARDGELWIFGTRDSTLSRNLPVPPGRILFLTWQDNETVITSQADSGYWWRHEILSGQRTPLWPNGLTSVNPDGSEPPVVISQLRDLAFNQADKRIAAVSRGEGRSSLVEINIDGKAHTILTAEWLGFPAWVPGGRIACSMMKEGRPRITLPCGGDSPAGLDTVESFGPIAFSPDGETLYLAILNSSGFTDLWEWSLARGNGHVMARNTRDTYRPTVSEEGSIVYLSQLYHTEIGVVRAQGGTPVRRSTFQSETPSWDPSGKLIGVTYGNWRRIADDSKYPDIAQEVGTIEAAGDRPAEAVLEVIAASASEDQGMAWSPNGKWQVFHSHQQESDDLWIRASDGSTPPERITTLGRGAEVGWPRWSPDGKWVVVDGDSAPGERPMPGIWLVAVDQVTGKITHPMTRIPVTGWEGTQMVHAEWLGGSDTVAFSTVTRDGIHRIYRTPRLGGTATLIHRYQSPQLVDGFGVSPDGSWLVFAAPGSGGVLQLFRLDLKPDAQPVELTVDPVAKTQPAVSPDGASVAFTAWRYAAQIHVGPRANQPFR